MLSYDPAKQLMHYPGQSMARFGLNPYGEALYRIIAAHSRRYLVVGEWPDGSIGAQWVPKYRAYGNMWVMERWLSAEQYCPQGKEHWDRVEQRQGPWPERGVYDFCHAFECSPPPDANLDKLVALIETGMRRRFAELLQWHKDDAIEKEKRSDRKLEDKIRSLLPAMGCRVMFSEKVNRGSEKVFGHGSAARSTEFRYSAQDMGMTKPGIKQVGARRRRAA